MLLKNVLLCAIPIFVAVDALGVLPIYVSWTRELNQQEKRKIILQFLWTGLAVAIGFICLSRVIFRYLGITMSDFMIAGGGILFCIAIMDLLQPDKKQRLPAHELGSVPLGVPLVVGPAVLTSALMLIEVYGALATLAAVTLNILFAGFVFLCADILMKVLGQNGARALSKIMALLLAAIAVMMIRKGIFQIISL